MATDYLKDPDAVLDYSLDWTNWLEAGEIITASVVTVSAGITLDSDSFTDTRATAWISGGTTGVVYTVSSRITTNLSRIDERTITIRVTNR